MSISREDVEYAAALAHVRLSEEDVQRLVPQVAGILEHIGHIGELDLSQVEPTSHPLDVVNRLRDDEPREPWERERLLANAPDPTADGFRVPRIGA